MMESFLFALGAVLPIVILVLIGYFLKKIKLIDEGFIKTANRLVFRVLLPVMLFNNIYKIEKIGNLEMGYVIFSVLAITAVFGFAVITSGFVTKDNPKRASLIQGIFRSNYALIGIPLAGSLFGEEGIIAASVLSAFTIPVFNILAVGALSVFGKGKFSIKSILSDIAKNPLILGVLAGFCALLAREIFISAGISFRLYDIKPIADAAGYLSSCATPIALMVLGGQFEFSAVEKLKKEIIFGTVMRCGAVPLFCIGSAALFFGGNFSGAQFAAITALFAAPVAVSSVPMAQEMGADVSLAGQLVVWTTVFSAFSVFAVSFVLKSIAIF
ncbi:MAG: AEC family transporter [Oscillospiraceae bacterium]|nr:AEC family transporter [Oscillospiraceae bacterium]MBR2639222.1 AEC family transporter [Oscillospiraceae bacterium]